MSYRKRNPAADSNPYADLYWSEPREGETVTISEFSVFIPEGAIPAYDRPYERAANPPRLDSRVATRSFAGFASRPSMRYTKARKGRR